MRHTKLRNVRVVPCTPPEWMKVQELYQSNDIECLKSSCEIFNMWKCRMGHSTPIFIDISELIHRAMLRDKSLSRDILDNTDIGLIFASAIIRFINFVNECCQPGVRSLSIATAVSKMEIPNWIVDIRHQAAHEHMPPVDYMRGALRFCREWLWERYWSRPFNEVMKEASKEIYEEEQAKKRSSVLDRTYDSLDKFTKWRKKNRNTQEIPATMRDKQPFKEIIECITLYPEEFIESFVEICISYDRFKKNAVEDSTEDTLFSKEKFTATVLDEEQNYFAPLVRLMSDKNHLSTLLVELSRQIADYSLPLEVRARLSGWAGKILFAFLQPNVSNPISDQTWKVILKHVISAPQFYEQDVIERTLDHMKGKIRDLTLIRVTKLLEIRECRQMAPTCEYSSFEVKTLNDLQNSIATVQDATSTKDPSNGEEDWTLCTLDELGALGLTSKQTAESLSLELDLSQY
ncbi:las1-like domain-containing protein [Ditylenchus destructor]|uniref:Las1-like domain-containing protein n=1 Tax=Ditylenchus destructor TaxID=166010 RepID=A0AAD4N433_9BILA|nr:las1-like domain-containing protein [Ditylenchus destructor]